MAEGKYGRLLTVADVHLIARELLRDDGTEAETVEDAIDRIDESAERMRRAFLSDPDEAFTFPPDEPLFLLRGQDKAAPATVSDYVENCKAVGADRQHFHAAADAYERMLAWQAEHPDRVKIPD